MPDEMKVQGKGLNKKFLFIAITLIAVGLIAALVLLLPTTSKAKKVEEQLNLGAKYLSELNYEQAIVAYEAVIKIDPKCEEAYLALVDVYIATGEFEKAEEVLKRAEGAIGSNARFLEEKWQEVLAGRKLAEGTPVPSTTPMPTLESTATPTITPMPISTATTSPTPTSTPRENRVFRFLKEEPEKFLSLDEVTFLGYSIEDLDIDTARRVMEENDYWVYGDLEKKPSATDSIYIFGEYVDGRYPHISLSYPLEDCFDYISLKATPDTYNGEKTPVGTRNINMYDTFGEVFEKMGFINAYETEGEIELFFTQVDIVDGNIYIGDEFCDDLWGEFWNFFEGVTETQEVFVWSGGAESVEREGKRSHSFSVRIQLKEEREGKSYVVTTTFKQDDNTNGKFLLTEYSIICNIPPMADLQESTPSPMPTATPIPSAHTIYDGTTVELSNAKIGDVVLFGSYEQDNIESNGAETIPWYVLDKEEDRLLLLSVYLLDQIQYNEEWEDVTWENCTLRQWMNDAFYNRAFTESERKHIQTSYLENADNPYYGTEGGNDTEDKVFALSLEEAERYFGIVEDGGWYWISAAPKFSAAKVTAYAEAQGAYSLADSTSNGVWLLRSPGNSTDSAVHVDIGAYVNVAGYYVDVSYYAARPALWLNLNP